MVIFSKLLLILEFRRLGARLVGLLGHASRETTTVLYIL